MKTVKDIWVLKSGSWFTTFDDKLDAVLALADQDFLESFPDGTVLTLHHGYLISDFEVPGTEYYNPDPKLVH